MTTEKITPAYVSYPTFVNMLDFVKGLAIMPTQIDNSLWKGKFSGSNGALLTASLKFLKLMDADKPTDQFESLVFADSNGRKKILKDILAQAYGSTIVELSNKTPKMVEDGIRNLGTTDSTHRKAVSFFIQAAKGADIPMPSTIAKRARNRPVTKKSPRTSGGDGQKIPPPPPPPSYVQGNRTVVDLQSGGSITLALDVDLFKLSEADQQFVLGLVKHVREYTSPKTTQ